MCLCMCVYGYLRYVCMCAIAEKWRQKWLPCLSLKLSPNYRVTYGCCHTANEANQKTNPLRLRSIRHPADGVGGGSEAV